MNFGDSRLPERFWDKTIPEPNTACWLWLGAVQKNGYGTVGQRRPKRTWRAHRFVFETLVGTIPDRLDIDHRCRVRCCVNPQHMEPVPRRVNVLRGVGFCARNAIATHCPAGHPYDEQNTYVRKEGWRDCRACRCASQAALRARRKRGAP